MAVIPHDVSVLKALSEFTPSTVHKPKSEASQEYNRLAASLIGEEYKPVKLKRFFRWINPKKQDINRTIFIKVVLNSSSSAPNFARSFFWIILLPQNRSSNLQVLI